MHCEMIIIINLVNIIITHSYKVFFLVMRTSKVYSLQFSHSVMSDSLRPHRLQHARLPYPSPTPELTQSHVHWVGDAIQHLIFCRPLLLPLIFPSIRVFSDESVLRIRWPKYWSFSFSSSPSDKYSGLISLGWTGWISLLSKGLSRVFANTTVQKHQFFSTQLSL